MVLTALGMAVGLCGAAFASRALLTLLFGISPLDPATYAGVVAALMAVSFIASAVPAWPRGTCRSVYYSARRIAG